jgi:hypothetical protein
MAWGSDTASTQLTTVTTEQFFSQTPTLNPGETAHCQITGNSSGTTDNLRVSVYATLDASTEVWDTVPLYSFVIDCTDGGNNIASFVVSGVYKFRVGVQRDAGSTDSFTADMSHRVDGVSL